MKLTRVTQRRGPVAFGRRGFFVGLQRERQIVVASENADTPLGFHGFRPDYGSGPYLALMAAAVELARRDMSNPLYSVECRSFLTGDLVALFAECIGYEGSFTGARND